MRFIMPRKDALYEMDISDEELREMLEAQPTLRAAILGHAARLKLKRLMSSYTTKVEEQDDHNRARRGSLTVHYKGCEIAIRCCSIQQNSIRRNSARFQCDASDRRPQKLPSGKSVETTCVRADSFDVAAISLYAITKRWDFAYVLPSDMRRATRVNKITESDRQYLLATTHKIPTPVAAPYVSEFEHLFDLIVAQRQSKKVSRKKGKRG